MKFIPTDLDGAYVVELEPHSDERGSFSRMFCAREFADAGMEPTVAQGNISVNPFRGTLRGMHYQLPPAAETKYVRCSRGAIYDAIVDLRPDSPTYLQSFGIELSAENRLGLFIPAMFGHGMLTLVDDTEINYLVSAFYSPRLERGIRYDDPVLDIAWPGPVQIISDKDAAWPPFDPEARVARGDQI